MSIDPNEVYVGMNGNLWMIDSQHNCGCNGCGGEKIANINNPKDIETLKELKEDLQKQIEDIDNFLNQKNN